jgi:hypothetical protein
MDLLARSPSSEPLSREPPVNDGTGSGAVSSAGAMPESLNPKRFRRGLIELAALVAVVAVFIRTGPGLGTLRGDISRASVWWLVAGWGWRSSRRSVTSWSFGRCSVRG